MHYSIYFLVRLVCIPFDCSPVALLRVLHAGTSESITTLAFACRLAMERGPKERGLDAVIASGTASNEGFAFFDGRSPAGDPLSLSSTLFLLAGKGPGTGFD